MSKGVAGQVGSSVSGGASPAVAGGVSGSVGVSGPPEDPSSRGRRRRRRYRHHHNRSLQKRSGKGYEFAFVTLLAMALLFWILYTLLPRAEKRLHNDEESHLRPHVRLSLLSLTG
jgi:hypothetical protein